MLDGDDVFTHLAPNGVFGVFLDPNLEEHSDVVVFVKTPGGRDLDVPSLPMGVMM